MGDPTDEFDELHWEIIDVLKEGRATPSYLSKRTGESRQLVSHRLRDLQLTDYVTKVHKGLYELNADPRNRRELRPDPIEDALTGWSHGRGEEKQQASEKVAHASLEWLRDQGDSVQKSDVPLDELQDSDPLGRQTNTLWKKVIKPSWDHAADGKYIEKPHSRAYRWAGPLSEENSE